MSPERARNAVAGAVCALLLLGAPPVMAQGVAPLDEEGPALLQSEDRLDDSLTCPEELAPEEPAVLLVPGTGLDGEHNFSWGYQPALEEEGFQVCTVDLLGDGLGDAQFSAERVVHAVRTIAAGVDGPVAVMGYSQGGAVARFALRFWRDVREAVDELVMVGAPVAGTTSFAVVCEKACPPSFWQMTLGSAFLAATNSTFELPGVEITSVFTYADEFVTPNDRGQASTLPGATNIAVQDICPGVITSHVDLGLVDPVAYELVLDALAHDGPADPARIPSSVCSAETLPGVSPQEESEGVEAARAKAADAYGDSVLMAHEPELRCHFTDTCRGDEVYEPIEASDAKPFGALRVVAIGMLVLGVAVCVWMIVRHRLEQARRRDELL